MNINAYILNVLLMANCFTYAQNDRKNTTLAVAAGFGLCTTMILAHRAFDKSIDNAARPLFGFREPTAGELVKTGLWGGLGLGCLLVSTTSGTCLIGGTMFLATENKKIFGSYLAGIVGGGALLNLSKFDCSSNKKR